MRYIDNIRSGTLEWLESVRYPDEGWGRWKYNAGMIRPYGLQCSGMAIRILDKLDVLDSVSDEKKRQAIRFFQSAQEPETGYFVDPLVDESDLDGPHSWEEVKNQMSSVEDDLRRLGGEPLYPLPRKRFVDFSQTSPRAFIDSLDWSNPWSRSEVVARATKAYLQSLPEGAESAQDPVVREALDYYVEKLVDPESGYPIRGGCAEAHKAMAGVFKIMMAFLAAGVPYPYAEQALDRTLAAQDSSGEFFSQANMCIQYDAAWVLDKLDRQLHGRYRRPAVKLALENLADALLSAYVQSDGGFAFERDVCQRNHHSVPISKPAPIGDMLGTHFVVDSLVFADRFQA